MGFWMGWSRLYFESRDAWPELLREMRTSSNPLDESLFKPLNDHREKLSEQRISGCEENSVLEGARFLKVFYAAHPQPP